MTPQTQTPAAVPIRPENFRALVAERIGNTQLRTNLARASVTSKTKRAAVVADYGEEWEQMRQSARAIKRHVLDTLPALLEQFETHVVAHGMQVHWARDAEEANRIVIDIARAAGARIAVKSKSMVTEETGLGHALAAAGIDPVETDLGEYIVQLAGEIPSHITGPAVHKSREEIGRLFAGKLGIPYTSDPAELTAIARRVLREKFLAAEVGISGVNFAVASTGTLCIVENEGNARLSTTLPRVHIAVMGIEKLVPDDASLALFLNMLARSATGQRMTCYTSLISGPRAADEIDGPDAVHVVLLDNGRSRILADPSMREILTCIRCGACMNTCPVYEKIGGHSYGSIYPGPIGAVLTPLLADLPTTKHLPLASSLCGACTEVCPVGIDLHHLLLEHRARIVRRRLTAPAERLMMRAFAFAMRHPALYRLGGRALRTFLPLLGEDATGAPRVPVWSRARSFPAPPPQTFAEMWEERLRREREEG